MHDQNDNMTETRGSLEEKASAWSTFKGFLCPCFKGKHGSVSSTSNKKEASAVTKEKTQSNTIYGINLARTQLGGSKVNNHRKGSIDVADGDGKKEGLLDKKTKKTRGEVKETIDIELGSQFSERETAPFTCSVCNYAQNQLHSIGINESHLLVKIQRVDINPTLTSIKKELTQSPKRKKERNQTAFMSPEFQKFWNQRYLIFQKFDEGVKLDKGSWSTTPPQLVSQFISSKCTGAKVLLDGFAGAGGTSIKLANVNSCIKLIANDWNGSKLSCLLNNAKVYEVQCNIQISEQDFLNLDKKSIDVVFVQPPYNIEAASNSKCLSIVDFQPTLNKVIMKSLRLAGDLLLLLPPQTSIQALCSCLNKCASQLKKMKNSCSIKIDKIYFQNEFKYILISMGNIVQKQIKLNDELQYIYGLLKKKGEGSFRHKKIIKRIREDHGMLELLNLLKISEKRAKEKEDKSGVLGKTEDIMDAFYEIIKEKELISPEKLQKLMEEQTPDSKKRPSLITSSLQISSVEKSKEEKEINLQAVMEEEKVEENDMPYRQSEQTQSDYSHYSYLSGLDKGQNSHVSRLMRLQSDSFSSVIIKRTLNGSREKRDISPNGSPVTPTRRNGKNRISQVPQKKQNAEYETKKRARDL